MSFPPQFLDEIRARVSISDLVGRRVGLTRRGREHVGLCPFHKEKTPSFTVSDDKGFFHCFGCGAHGDVIGFVMRADNLPFPEAVERLAKAAGLEMPARRPEDRQAARKRDSLYEVLERACAWFEAALAGPDAAAARDYLDGRGLSPEIRARFRLGFAPDDRHGLKRALTGAGIAEQALIEAGLVIAPEDGGASYDRFRGRIIFPITDQGDRVVGFGGRAMGDRRPKYLNSPETPLFHKGLLLYGLALARKAARESGEIVVAEGYMDVIALHRAGVPQAVAPLGTALTEDQIRLLWRIAPEPIVCFDGDAAGHRAALRAAERALPLLAPGRSLRFAALPPGEDPDSLLARRGAAAVRAALDAARPLIDLLWERETEGRRLDTPERCAALEKALRKAIGRIGDESVRGHYGRAIRDRLDALFGRGGARPARRPRGRGDFAPGRFAQGDFPRGNFAQRGFPRAGTGFPGPRIPDPLGQGAEGLAERRERLLVTMIVNRPELLARIEEEFTAAPLSSPELDRLRRAILEIAIRAPDLDSAGLKDHLSTQGFSRAVERLSAPLHWSERRLEDKYLGADVPLSELERGWRHVLSCHGRSVTMKAELRAAERDLAENMTDENFARLKALKREIERNEREIALLDEPAPEPGDEAGDEADA